MWKAMMEWLKWLVARLLKIPPTSLKTDQFEIKAATAGSVIRMLQALKDYEGKPRRTIGGLESRSKGTRDAHHSEAIDRPP